MMDTEKPLDGVHHVLTNLRFVTDGPDRAIGTFYVTAYLPGAAAGQPTLPFAMGQCTDHYVRTADGWKVQVLSVRAVLAARQPSLTGTRVSCHHDSSHNVGVEAGRP